MLYVHNMESAKKKCYLALSFPKMITQKLIHVTFQTGHSHFRGCKKSGKINASVKELIS